MKQVFLFISLISFNFSIAQNDSISFRRSPATVYNKPNLNSQFFKSFLLDARDVATFPKYCNWKHGLIIGGVLVTDGVLFLLDRNIDDIFLNTKVKR